MKKWIVYKIEATVRIDTDYPEGITDMLDRIREEGEAEVVEVTLEENNES